MKTQFSKPQVIELRKNHRYRFCAPVFFYWATPNEPVRSGEGVTRDVDTNGAYINVRELPPVGALVQLEIMLPSLSGGGTGAHLSGEGVVLRVEPHNGNAPGALANGFAVSAQFSVKSSESVLSHLKRSGPVM